MTLFYIELCITTTPPPTTPKLTSFFFEPAEFNHNILPSRFDGISGEVIWRLRAWLCYFGVLITGPTVRFLQPGYTPEKLEGNVHLTRDFLSFLLTHTHTYTGAFILSKPSQSQAQEHALFGSSFSFPVGLYRRFSATRCQGAI